MRSALLILALLLSGLSACQFAGQPAQDRSLATQNADTKASRNAVPVIHVFVALCDNVNQGIVPVAPSLGNGDDPARNLYWGAAFGIKTFFTKSKNWQAVDAETQSNKAESVVLERSIFKRRDRDVFLVAEAYRGSYIQRATRDFLEAAAGTAGEAVNVSVEGKSLTLNLAGSLSAAIEGWLRKETDEEIRLRAAKAYDQYQNCGLQSANKLFATGW
jgi:hypothetical protein